jgi:hypothetical protein
MTDPITDAITDAGRVPTSVAVCGSCTSRDNFNSRFNPDHGRWFRLTAEVFQTSMISLMSPPVEPDLGAADPKDYKIRITREDMTREFLGKLAAARPDFLVLDFFADIHFGILRLEDGRYLTDNRWMLWPTDYYRRLKDTQAFETLRIFDDPDRYLALWTEAMDRFAAFVAEHCPDTRVIVHRGLNTDQVVVPGQAQPVPLRQHQRAARLNVRRANELWARLDDHAISAYGWDAIDLRDEGYTSYAEHPWKPFYVHYTPDYNHRFLSELHVRDLQRELDPGTWAQVHAIVASGHEHAVRYGPLWTYEMRRREQRIRELEGLGVLGSVKFALGRRLRQTRARLFPKSKEAR